jgi:hypothetical protein
MSVLINASTSTGLVQSADTSGEIELQSNGTTALKVNTNEGIQILNCLGVGNATPSTSGAGITFPATQSASSDANTLDDYEEGTWTVGMQIGGSATGITFGTRSATYTKIGRQVTVCFGFALTSKGAGSGAVELTGLPFASLDNGGFSDPVVSFGYSDSTNLAASPIMGLVARGTTTITPRKMSGGNTPILTNTDLNNGSALIGSATYFV